MSGPLLLYTFSYSFNLAVLKNLLLHILKVKVTDERTKQAFLIDDNL
ncbi:hypothetical protein QY96_01116 [Bacillus thermotolerans]|nr:hypothetical protein QY96_01116 [Bacillus thermotolerans]